MLVLHVTIQVKPEHASEFLEVARYDAEHSEKDEPGACASTSSRTATMPTGSIFTRSTGTRRRWKRTARLRTSRFTSRKFNLAGCAVGAPLRQKPDTRRRRVALKRENTSPSGLCSFKR